MTTERLLQFCVSSMAVLATVMLGTSQENSVLPVAAFLAATVSLLFTDYFRWFSLHPFVAGALGLVAGLYALALSQTNSLADQFVSVANLLIHLQIILLFQKKSIRIYWQLMTLSLLQVVVAAALNLFVFFGPLLVLYTGIAICAMILFFIYRETHPLFEARRKDENSFIHVATTQPRAADRKDPRKRSRRNLFRLTGLRSFAMLSISTLVVSLAVFLLMPRFGDGVWRPSKAKSAATGFNGDEIDLDVGSLYENPSVVMRVSFTDEETNQPYIVSGSPYFRGSALSEYEKGSWSRVRDLDEKHMSSLDRPQRLISAVRQTVNLETPKRQVVFSVPPAVALEDTTDSIRIKHRTNETRYYPKADEDQAVYSLGTLGFRNGLQSQYSPKYSAADNVDDVRRKNQVERDMPELANLASEIVSAIPAEDALARARVLESYFTDGTKGFKYSLDGASDVQRDVDRVVDFVMNHKTGHCQYYASALALMLRSQGIPSRIVVGYRAETYNIVGNYYQLREMDAHAWVEAGIPADQIPTDEILPAEGIRGDAWVRLDPTPSGDFAIAGARISPWKAKLGDTIDYMQLLWSEYVLGLNEKRQRRAIYEPLQAFFKTSTILLFSREIWAARWESLLERFQGDLFTRDNIRDSVIAVAVLFATFFVLRVIWRLLGKGFSRLRRRDRRSRPQVDFYVRFEKLLSKYGIRRRIEQTPLEFAKVAQQRLDQLSADASLLEIPKNTVDLFYRVRFGSGPLDTEEAERLENSLGRLQNFLATHRN